MLFPNLLKRQRKITVTWTMPCKKCPPCLCGTYCRSCDCWLFSIPGQDIKPSTNLLCDICLRTQQGSSSHVTCKTCHWKFNSIHVRFHISWWCRKRGLRRTSILHPRIYYCYICHEEMHPPSSESRPTHG
jgi:hypothetical protein